MRLLLIFSFLVAAGLAGNFFRIPLFFGVDFLFGSIAALVAVRVLGLAWGALAAALIASYTVVLWGHPYALVVLTLEAVWVGWWLRRRHAEDLTFPDAAFWFVLGMPLVFLLFSPTLETGLQATTLTALKSGINGIFNALIATLIVTYFPRPRWLGVPARPAISLQSSLFHLLAAGALGSVLVLLVITSRLEFGRIESAVRTDLQKQLDETAEVLDVWRREYRIKIATLATEGRNMDAPAPQERGRLQYATELLHYSAPDLRRLRLLDQEGTVYTSSPTHDVLGQPNIGRNFANRPLFQEMQETHQAAISDVFRGRVGVPSLIITYGVPIIRGGEFNGYAEGVLNLNYLGALLVRIRGDAETAPDVTVLDRAMQVVASTNAEQYPAGQSLAEILAAREDLILRRYDSGVYQWVSEAAYTQPAMNRWGASIYARETEFADEWGWSLIAEAPAAPYQSQLYSRYLIYFATGLGLVLLSLLLSHLISRRLASPLAALAALTSRLPERQQGRQEPEHLDWPQSRWLEFNNLTNNFRHTAETLEESFRGLYATNEKLSALIDASPLAIFSLDEHGKLTSWNPTAERIFGWQAREVLGEPPPFILEEREYDYLRAQEQILAGEWFTEMECRLLRKDGALIVVSLSAAPLRDPQGHVRGSMAMLADISERKRIAAEAAYRVRHDLLTGLLNRHAFGQQVERFLMERDGLKPALLYIGLDQFKLINDACGHAGGDALLQQIALLLQQQVGETGIVARLGGDEFGILLVGSSLEQSQRIGKGILDAVREFHFVWEDRQFDVTVSMGLVMLDHTIEDLEQAFTAAEHAYFTAKDKGRNQIQIYRPEDQNIVRRSGEMAWVHRIRQALKENRFFLHRQAVVAVQPGLPVEHYEVLLRMRDPEGHTIGPDRFIPSAEQYNLMPEVDRWVIRNVCALQQRERTACPGRLARHYAINLSGNTVGDEHLMAFVREQFEYYETDPASIGFEITETAAMANFSRAVAFVNEVRAMGCQVYLDDFGSGLSSFGYLRTLQVDALKIDRIFLQSITTNSVDYAMVDAIYRIGHVSGLRVIAEGVENTQTLDCLQDIGIDSAQGYAIHRPELYQLAT